MFDGRYAAFFQDVLLLQLVAFQTLVVAFVFRAFQDADRHIVRRVAMPFRFADKAADIVVNPNPKRVLHVVADPDRFAVELHQFGGIISIAEQRYLSAPYRAHHLRSEQIPFLLRRHSRRLAKLRHLQSPKLIRRHMPAFAIAVGKLRQRTVRSVVIFVHHPFDIALKLIPSRNRRIQNLPVQADFLTRQLKQLLPRLVVHIFSHKRRQVRRRPCENIMAAFRRALRLRVISPRMRHRHTQPAHQTRCLIRHHQVFKATTPVHIPKRTDGRAARVA